MGDFTKKELKDILIGISWWVEGLEHVHLPVLEKLRNLIDNYDSDETPKPKYAIGDTVWFSGYLGAVRLLIEEMSLDDQSEWLYHGIRESSLHPSRQVMIQFQIAQLENMLEEESCSHEIDHLYHVNHPPKGKCKKCGEFY